MECMKEDPDLGMVSEAESNSTIINSLNADCWRLILDYLSVQELLQTERTCKDWQKLVLDHISHRRIMIQDKECDENTLILRKSSDVWASFKCWLQKRGRSVQKLDADCEYFEDVVEVLRDSCPNLEVLKLSNIKEKLSPTNTLHFQKLTRLAFRGCHEITDDCVIQFLSSDMNELSIIYNQRVTGSFLNNLETDKIKCLELDNCRELNFSFLLSCADRLKNLTTLVLYIKNRSEIGIRNKLHLLLDKMPNLEEINFKVDDKLISYDEQHCPEASDVFFESRSKKLRRFDTNFDVWDQHLEALAMNCRDLVAVRSPCNQITVAGLAALCLQLGPQLLELNLYGSRLRDDYIIACVYACPKLMWLDCFYSDSIIDRIAAARRDMRANLLESKYSNNKDNNLRFRLQLVLPGECVLDEQPDDDIREVIEVKYRYEEPDSEFEYDYGEVDSDDVEDE